MAELSPHGTYLSVLTDSFQREYVCSLPKLSSIILYNHFFLQV